MHYVLVNGHNLHYSTLCTFEKKRYEKITVIGFDPHKMQFVSVQKDINDDLDTPLITYPDILNYLVLEFFCVTTNMNAVELGSLQLFCIYICQY